MARLKHHPDLWLRDDAAAALNAYEDAYGVISINSAGRTEAEQNGLIAAWDRGGWQNRPPYLYEPARPARTSRHVMDGGIALDTSDVTKFRQHCEEFGFVWYGQSDPVHFEFRGGGNTGYSRKVFLEQQFLNWYRNEKLATDGIKGSATTEAYKRYQTFLRNNYGYTGAIDGIWGDGTQAAHAKYYVQVTATPGPSRKATGELSYAEIQAALNKFGYNLAVDNIWGRASSNALADFQSRNGLVVDRIVGEATRAKLGI